MRVLLRWLLVVLVVILSISCIYGKRSTGGGTNIGSGSEVDPWAQGGRTGPAAVGER